ncbi:MAG: hypothetical protein AB8B61_06795 [Cyclobacteriaceae bacterium]
MKVQFLGLLILFFVFSSCSNETKDVVETEQAEEKRFITTLSERFLLIRASRFNDQLEHFSEDAENEINYLSTFIDPNVNPIDIAFGYYHHWYDNRDQYIDLVSNIVGVELTSETEAYVVVQEIWQIPDSQPLEWISKTKWKKIMGTWYRTSAPSKLYFDGVEVKKEEEEEKHHLNLENY